MATLTTLTTTTTSSSTPTPATPTPSPSPTEKPHRGLTITTTIGVGVGVAGVVIILFAVAFICIRRRRRKWGQKRKAQGEPEIKGDTPEEEILKRVKGDEGSVEAVEIAGEEARRAELGGDAGAAAGGDEKDRKGDDVREMYAGQDVVELAAQERPVEIGEGAAFIAELDSTEIARRKTLKEKQQRKEKSGEEEDKVLENTEPIPERKE